MPYRVTLYTDKSAHAIGIENTVELAKELARKDSRLSIHWWGQPTSKTYPLCGYVIGCGLDHYEISEIVPMQKQEHS